MRKLKRIALLFLISFIFICMNKKIFATTISFSNNSPKVGDSVTVTVTVPNVHTADVHATINGAGVSSTVDVVGGDLSGSAKSYSNSVTVKPTSTGTISVVVTSASNAVLNGGYVNVGASANLSVAEKSSNSGNSGGSNNTNQTNTSNPMITSLGITPYDYDFSNYKIGTASGTTFYASVPNEVSTISIYANTQAGGTISGTGNKNLSEGTNKFTVSNGYYTYYISVNRKTLEGEEPANKEDDEEEEEEKEEKKDNKNIGIKKLVIKDYELTEKFDSNIFEYTVNIENKLTIAELKEIIQNMEVILDTDNVIYEATPQILDNGYSTITIVVKDDKKDYSTYVITFVPENNEDDNKVIGAIVPIDNNKGMFGLTAEQQIYAVLGAFGIVSLMALSFAISSYVQSQRLLEYEYDEEYDDEEIDETEDKESIEDRNYSEFEKINRYRDSVKPEEPKVETKTEIEKGQEAQPAVSLAKDEASEEKDEEKEESNLSRALNFERKLAGFRSLKSERKTGGKHF